MVDLCMLAVFQVVGNSCMHFTLPQPQKILVLVIVFCWAVAFDCCFFVNEVIVLLSDSLHTL